MVYLVFLKKGRKVFQSIELLINGAFSNVLLFCILNTRDIRKKKKKRNKRKNLGIWSPYYIETSPLICREDQLTGFSMRGDLHHNATYTEDLSKHMKDET